MGKKIYKKLEPTSVQGICVKCGIRKQSGKGKGLYRPLCKECHCRRHSMVRRSSKEYTKYKGPICELCGFKPVHSCQLDVDHIDGDHKNNDPINLQTLCANCHRLKTYLNQDWKERA